MCHTRSGKHTKCSANKNANEHNCKKKDTQRIFAGSISNSRLEYLQSGFKLKNRLKSSDKLTTEYDRNVLEVFRGLKGSAITTDLS